MKRLIDDMNAADMKLSWARWSKGIDAWCDEMCNPIPEWYDTLDPNDDQTWVLCNVSYHTPYECDEVVWIGKYKESEVYRFGIAGSWKKQFFRYATPVDLNLRYATKQVSGSSILEIQHLLKNGVKNEK